MNSSKTSYTPLLIVLLIVASFFLGSLVTKVQYLEKSGNTTPPQVAGTQQNQQATQTQPNQPQQPTKEDIKKWAKEIGLNTNKFNTCFDSGKYKSVVEKDIQAGQTGGVGGTPSFFINGHLVVGALPYAVFQKIIDFELKSGDWNNPDDTVKDLVDGNQQNGEIGKEKTNIDNGHLPAQGNSNAKVTMVEFSDFQCPYCKNFFTQTLPQIKKDYVNSGKVVLYYRHYPLPFHPLAQPFAEASECANEQGKFWQFHDKIFESQ